MIIIENSTVNDYLEENQHGTGQSTKQDLPVTKVTRFL